MNVKERIELPTESEFLTDTLDVESTEDGIQVNEVSVGVTNGFISKGRMIALARAVCMLITSVAALLGFALDAGTIFNVVSTILMAVSLGWGYWKNNNWTEKANLVQSLFMSLKNSKVIDVEVNEK